MKEKSVKGGNVKQSKKRCSRPKMIEPSFIHFKKVFIVFTAAKNANPFFFSDYIQLNCQLIFSLLMFS